MPFSPDLRYSLQIMLEIPGVYRCLFEGNVSIGQPPRERIKVFSLWNSLQCTAIHSLCMVNYLPFALQYSILLHSVVVSTVITSGSGSDLR